MSGDVLVITREELYELVWSKPMMELAKDFGISDVGLAKRCKRLGVPVPGRGYWARVAAGQSPIRPSPRKVKTPDAAETNMKVPVPREEPEAKQPSPTEVGFLGVRTKILELQPQPITALSQASGPVKRSAFHLKRLLSKDAEWKRGEKEGPILRINVSNAVADRALRISDLLVVGAESLGWKFAQHPKSEERRRNYYHDGVLSAPVIGYFQVEGETIWLRIDERHRQVDHVPTDYEKEQIRRKAFVHLPPWDMASTGDLRVYVAGKPDERYTARIWKDGVKKRLEHQVQAVLLGMLNEAIEVKEARERKRIADIETKRQEKIRSEQSERRSANEKLVNQLEAQAGAWFRARILRSYVRALKKALGTEQCDVEIHDRTVDFVGWAEHYIDQLDPFSQSPHDLDHLEDRTYYSSDDAKLKSSLARMLGIRWQDALKMLDQGSAETANPESGDELPEVSKA